MYFSNPPEAIQKYPVDGIKFQESDSLPDLEAKQSLISFPEKVVTGVFPLEVKDKQLQIFMKDFIHSIERFKNGINVDLDVREITPFFYHRHYSLETIANKLELLEMWFDNGYSQAGQVLASIYRNGLKPSEIESGWSLYERPFLFNSNLNDNSSGQIPFQDVGQAKGIYQRFMEELSPEENEAWLKYLNGNHSSQLGATHPIAVMQ